LTVSASNSIIAWLRAQLLGISLSGR